MTTDKDNRYIGAGFTHALEKPTTSVTSLIDDGRCEYTIAAEGTEIRLMNGQPVALTGYLVAERKDEEKASTRRLTAAFTAIAEAVRADGWRLVTDDGLVVRRSASCRATGCTLRRLCDNGAIDAVRIMITDSLGERMGDLDMFVKVVIEELRGRDKANPGMLPYLGQRGVSFAKDHTFYTLADMEQAYADGKARGMAKQEDHPCPPQYRLTGISCGSCKSPIAATIPEFNIMQDCPRCGVRIKPAAAAVEHGTHRGTETTVTTLADLTSGISLYADDGKLYRHFKLTKS